MTRGVARRRVLLSRDTLVGLLVVLIATATCIWLGAWQYGRFETARAAGAIVEENYSAQPVSLAEVLDSPAQPLPAEQEWLPVQMTGTYCTSDKCVLYARNRPLSGDVGFWQLAPFRANDGTELLIVRGWVPAAAQESVPADPPPVPEGEVTVTARLRPIEPVLDRELPPGQVHSVNPAQIGALLPGENTQLVTGAYGELASEDPVGPHPRALPAPDTSVGMHVSYAFQWWIFAAFFPAALILRTRKLLQEAAQEEQSADAGSAPADADVARTRPSGMRTRRASTGRTARVRRRSQDEMEEDALIDQHRGQDA